MAAEQRRRKPGSTEGQERVLFPPPSAAAKECQEALSSELYKVDWTWKGPCAGCEQQYGKGLRDGRCESSRPKPVGNVELRNDIVLVDMIGELGAIGLHLYFAEVGWTSEPTATRIAKHRGTKRLCPRCRAFDAWAYPRAADFTKRAEYLAKKLMDPGGLTELPEELDTEGASDVFVSSRVRELLNELRQRTGRGGQKGSVAVVVRSGFTCYMLWRLLSILQGMWYGKPELGVTRDELKKRLLGRSVKGNGTSVAGLKCARYLPGAMGADELQMTRQHVQESRVSVVVMLLGTNVGEQPEASLGCNSVLLWDQFAEGPTRCISTSCTLGKMEREAHSEKEASTVVPPPPPPPLPPTSPRASSQLAPAEEISEENMRARMRCAGRVLG